MKKKDGTMERLRKKMTTMTAKKKKKKYLLPLCVFAQ